MREHPWYVGGTGTLVTQLGGAVPGLLAKNGAEGGFAAALPDGRALAVKVLDGSPRALPALVVALLRALGVEAPAPDPVLGGGAPVGEVRPTSSNRGKRCLGNFPHGRVSALRRPTRCGGRASR